MTIGTYYMLIGSSLHIVRCNTALSVRKKVFFSHHLLLFRAIFPSAVQKLMQQIPEQLTVCFID